MAIDPTKPISDHSVFLPNGLWINNHDAAPASRASATDPSGDDEKTFVLNAGSMKALNRFLGTGRFLQTDRKEYLRWLGIDDNTSDVSDKLGDEIDLLMTTYATIKKDCTEFRDVTWEKIIEVATGIKSHASMSGGKVDTSYYTLMLQYIGYLHDENEKPNPDPAMVKQYEDVILALVKDELKKIQTLIDGAEECKTGLKGFEDKCTGHGIELGKNISSLETQLTKEGNDISAIQSKIDAIHKEINDTQEDIDFKNKQIREAPAYMWIWPIGTAVGTGIIVEAKKERARLEKVMDELRVILQEYDEKMRLAVRLQTNTTAIKSQVNGLSGQIQPAIETLQQLQGAWGVMKADLISIKDLVELNKDSIPPMIIAPNLMQKIVDEWNELKSYVTEYIEIAYLSPPQATLDEYINAIKE